MNHGRLPNSPRLQRVLAALQATKGELSSMELAKAAGAVAPGTAVSEFARQWG